MRQLCGSLRFNGGLVVRRHALFALLVFMPVLLSAVAGCGNNETPVEPKKFALPKEVKRTLLEAKSLAGIVQGKVDYDGDPPPLLFIDRINDHEDKKGCLKGGPAETSKPTWIVHKESGAIANVVVWLEPPPGKYFSLAEQDKNRAGEVVVVDQPHCMFVPHVVSLFPSYFDGVKQVKTGQKLEIRNTAPFLHAVQWNPTRENEVYTQSIPANGGKLQFVLNPQKSCLAIGCGIHNWMHGILWIFEHPYHAVTREDGTFEIKNVPTDVELTFVAWHESNIEPFLKQKMTFQKGANPPIELKHKK
jgi:hypothetical protein